MANIYNLVDTWNDAGTTYTGIGLNATDTASNAASLLMDLQVGGSSKFSVTKAGTISSAATGAATSVVSATNFKIYSNIYFAVESGGGIAMTLERTATTGLRVGSTMPIGWSSSVDAWNNASDLLLTRKAAASLRLGAADAAAPVAQTFGVQSVVAGTTNTAGANFTIAGSQGTGTGAGGSIIFQVAPAGSSGTAQNALTAALTIAATGTITSSAAVVTGGDLYVSGLSNAALRGVSSGVMLISNTSFNDFGRLQFGGTTSSFPAIKRNGAGIDVVGADGTNVSFVRVPGVAVASLPSAATAGIGARSFVTDATATTYASTVAGGGANKVPVFSDGTNWIIG